MTSQTIFVLGGGNAIGAYSAGVCEEFSAQGFKPDWIIGASAGAVIGAILAGNPPEAAAERLQEFWSAAAIETPPVFPGEGEVRKYYNAWHATWSLLAGRAPIFRHRWPGLWSALPGVPQDISIFDHSPLGATIERLVDFDYLNASPVRLSVCCVNIETGGEVVFDSAREQIRPEHILASAAITPAFPPVIIDGRMLCDPGYVNNTPVDVAFAAPPDRDTLCVMIELFSLKNPRPASLDAVLERTQDIMFASPTRKAVEALHREYALRSEAAPGGPAITLLHVVYPSASHELASKAFDFSPASISERWMAGRADGKRAVAKLHSSPRKPGFTYVPP